MKATWYWCDLLDRYELDEKPEPDWSKVPEPKRDDVRRRWAVSQEAMLQPMRCKLWGPQIAWYQRQPKYGVTVIGEALL